MTSQPSETRTVRNIYGILRTVQLVTQSTRHKEAVNSSQTNKKANIKAVLPQQYNY